MGWLIENGWSTRNGKYWVSEASDLGDPNMAKLPHGRLIASVLWEAQYRDGELVEWVGVDADNIHYTIFND